MFILTLFHLNNFNTPELQDISEIYYNSFSLKLNFENESLNE